ncbi:MAG: SpoIIE family protein phosphatase, partial [Candidatus Hydrogenedentota bacterium]
LGHGPSGEEASDKAVAVFNENKHLSPAEIIEEAHPALRSTRGAAIAVAEVNRGRNEVCYAGIGNIRGVILSSKGRRSMISHNGIVGLQIRKIQEFTYPWPDDGVLVMHSDGLGSRWELERYPGLIRKHPALIAGTLYRDFYKGSDDVAVVVVRERARVAGEQAP